ncbi:unnamed protein product [Lymnaea stagnalis]|uniref:IRF tryptophan pentad repeat domain-containing protein n=1 Tax=Lymnaea stagnalis TaxID=6523 RepID=A0AAV2INQ3_LYMST
MMAVSQQQNKESRSGLLQFLEDALNNKKIKGLEWIDKEKKIWQLPWKHHRPTRWGDPDSFVLCEIGKHMYGFTGTEPAQEDLKNWKEKFRNALRSLGVKELEEHRNQEGNNPIKVYQFNNDPMGGRKTRGRTRGETVIARRSNNQNQLLNPQDMSCSNSGSDVFDQSTDFTSFFKMPFRSRSPVHEFSDINTDGFSGNLDSMTPNIPHDLIGDIDVTPNIPLDLVGASNLNAVSAPFRSSYIPIPSPLVAENRNIVENSPNHCSKIFRANTYLFTNLQNSKGLVANNLGRLPAHQMNISEPLINQNIPNMICFNKENHHKGIKCLDGVVHTKNASGHVMNNVSGYDLNDGTGHAITNDAGLSITNGARNAIPNGAGLCNSNDANYHMPSSCDMNIDLVDLDHYFMNSRPEEVNAPLMVLEVKYHNETALYESITEDTFRFCYVPNNRLREVITSCPSEEQFGPTGARLIELPSAHLCPNLNEQEVAVTQGVLNNMERGVTIFYRNGDIHAKRLCKAVPFHYIPKERKSQKLERETEVKIFDFNCNFLKSGGQSQPFVFLSFSVRDPERVKAPVLSVKLSHILATQIKRNMQSTYPISVEPECSLSNEFDTRLKIEQNLLSAS